MSSSRTRIWWYPIFKSSFENTFAPCNCSNRSLMLGKGYLFFDGLLVDTTVVLNQPTSTILLLHKKTRGTPRRSARTNEPIFLKLNKLLFQLNQLFRTHLVRLPRYRLCTRF